ncbi:MAG: hypothetical protein ABI758_02155 [Candidatus Woesebacteria bacterium]
MNFLVVNVPSGIDALSMAIIFFVALAAVWQGGIWADLGGVAILILAFVLYPPLAVIVGVFFILKRRISDWFIGKPRLFNRRRILTFLLTFVILFPAGVVMRLTPFFI